MEPGPSFVDVRSVSVSYVRPAGLLGRMTGQAPQTQSVLRDVSFKTSQGMWLTVFGTEGAGKTTLLRLLAGVLKPSSGKVIVNGKAPHEVKDLAAGYISSEESEPERETVHDVLHAFGTTHNIANLPARIGAISERVGLETFLHRPARLLSRTQRLRLNIARAALSDAPIVLFDDTADELGVAELSALLEPLFKGRTVIIATRFVQTAEALNLPILLLHDARLAQVGTRDEIANNLSCPRVLDVWVEGLRYDLLRKIRHQAGVIDVRLLPSSRFSGQRLRITLHSSRYLPSIYDTISQAPLVRVEELPASLVDILAKL